MKAGRAFGAAAIAAGALAFAGVATAAPGDTVYKGETSEGNKVKLTVASAGNPTKFKVGKTEVECGQGTLSNRPGTYVDFDRSDPGSFKDKRETESSSGEFDFETKSKITGEVDAGGASWTGTLKFTTKVFEGNEQIDTCKLNTEWTAE